MEMEIDFSDLEVAKEADDILESILFCVERGEGKGVCHVFIDHSDLCQCGQIDLKKERMR